MKFGASTILSRDYLLSRVSELDIFLHWCTDFKALDRNFKSPIIISGDDNLSRKSGIIGYYKNFLVFRDFRIGKSFNYWSFASFMSGLKGNDLLEYLYSAFHLRDANMRPKQRMVDIINHKVKVPKIINVKYSSWDYESISYWTQYGWSPHMIDTANIRPIEIFWIDDMEFNRPFIGPISFSYDFGDVGGIYRRKIYNPMADKKIKWFSNSTKDTVQGLHTIDHHPKTLYLTSSLKDCGPFWTLNGEPCAIAPNSESSLLLPSQVRMLRQISDEQIIWYDNDFAGIMNAKKHSQLYGFKIKFNPLGSPKDPSDYVKIRGLREFNKLITDEIN